MFAKAARLGGLFVLLLAAFVVLSMAGAGVSAQEAAMPASAGACVPGTILVNQVDGDGDVIRQDCVNVPDVSGMCPDGMSVLQASKPGFSRDVCQDDSAGPAYPDQRSESDSCASLDGHQPWRCGPRGICPAGLDGQQCQDWQNNLGYVSMNEDDTCPDGYFLWPTSATGYGQDVCEPQPETDNTGPDASSTTASGASASATPARNDQSQGSNDVQSTADTGNGGLGYVSGTNGDGVNCRAEADINSASVTTLSEGENFKVAGPEESGWLPILTDDGASCYISTQFAGEGLSPNTVDPNTGAPVFSDSGSTSDDGADAITSDSSSAGPVSVPVVTSLPNTGAGDNSQNSVSVQRKLATGLVLAFLATLMFMAGRHSGAKETEGVK